MEERVRLAKAKQIDNRTPKTVVVSKLFLAMIALVALCASAVAQENTAEEWYKKGRNFDTNGYYQEAIEAFDKVIQIDPMNASAWLDKGNALVSLALVKNDGFDEAIKAFDKATEINPQYEEAWFRKGDTLLLIAMVKHDLEKYNESLKSLNEALEINPTYVDAWTTKASVLLAQQKNVDAIETVDKALNLDRNNSGAWITRANALANLHRYNESVEAYAKAIENTPPNLTEQLASTWFQKSNVLQMSDRMPEANEAFDKTLKLDPKNIYLWMMAKGDFLNKTGKHEEAIKAYDEIIESVESSKSSNAQSILPKVWYNKGLALKALSFQDKADEAFAKAEELGNVS